MAERTLNDNDPCDSTQSSLVADQLRMVENTRGAVNYQKCVVLHCAKCSIVLGDSLGVCGEVKNIKSIICFRVTKDVKVRGKFEVCMDGPLALCTYRMLECGCCCRFVGVMLHSTPQNLSFLRNFFLLRKDVITCYLLKNSTMVKASKISFDNRPLRRRIRELKQDLEAQVKQVNILKEMLEDVNIQSEGGQIPGEESLSLLY